MGRDAGQAAHEISATRKRFSVRDIYAAAESLRLAAELAELRPMALDMLREALITSEVLHIDKTWSSVEVMRQMLKTQKPAHFRGQAHHLGHLTG